MRLIDADELLLKLNEIYDEADAKYHETDFDSFYGGSCSMIQEVIKEITEQSTYDVDKVVEQLKMDSSVKLYGSGNSNNYLISLEKVIEIVKAGGNIELSEHSESQGN